MDNNPVEGTSIEQKTQAVRKGCLPSEDDKIRECVNFGSVFLGLETGFITVKGLLKWLTTAAVTDATRVAYKALCIGIPPDQQYLEDNYHFLVKKPDYISIALGFGFIPEIPDQNLPNVNNPVLCHVVEALTKYHNDKNLRKIITLILTGTGSQSYVETCLDLCYQARNSPHIRTLTPHEVNIAIVEADWTAKLRYNETLPLLIIKRAIKLQEKAPLYYAHVAYQAYHAVAVRLNKSKLLTALTRKDLAMFNNYFPNIIDTRILEYDDLSYKIALFGNDIAGYVLGFPIQNIIPNDEQIHEALNALKEMGSKRYIEHIRNYVAQTYNPVLPFTQKNIPTYPNERDVSYEDINNYVPFDIIACQIGSHIHRFSRVEADNLLETKKNPWTGEWLPVTVLSTIKARVEAAKELGLPPARSLEEILDRINNGTLFTPDASPSSAPPPIPRPMQLLVPPTLFESMFQLAGNWAPGYDDDDEFQLSFTNNEGLINDFVPQGREASHPTISNHTEPFPDMAIDVDQFFAQMNNGESEDVSDEDNNDDTNDESVEYDE